MDEWDFTFFQIIKLNEDSFKTKKPLINKDQGLLKMVGRPRLELGTKSL